MLHIQYFSDYISQEFDWKTVITTLNARKQDISQDYLNKVKALNKLNESDLVAIFKKLTKHENSPYWYHYLYFKHFLNTDNQRILFSSLMQETNKQDAKGLLAEIGKWNPSLQRRFLSMLSDETRQNVFSLLDKDQLISIAEDLKFVLTRVTDLWDAKYI